MTSKTIKRSPETMIQITGTRHGVLEKHLLLIDRQTRFNLAASPIPERYQTDADLVSSLIARGAVWHDGKDQAGDIIPAIQNFDEQTQHRTYLCHYREGTRQDPAKGIYAEQFFDANTGKSADRQLRRTHQTRR